MFVQNSFFKENNKVLVFLGIYFILSMLLLAYTPRLLKDSFYYLEWSRHLGLSYYDGPPLIAYLLRLQTAIFGNNQYSLKLFALLTNSTTAWVIYLIAKEMFGKKIAFKAVLLWCLTPFICRIIGFQTTYNNPLVLFWALTIYYFYLYHKYEKTHFIYLAGFTGGLLLLSKYTAVLLGCSLITVIVLCKDYRNMLYNPHLYFAAMLSMLLFSPVLLWNYQHAWISFHFQLTSHHLNSHAPLSNIIFYLSKELLSYNLPLILILAGGIHYIKSKVFNNDLLLLMIISFWVLLFFAISAYSTHAGNSWSVPFYVSGSILAAYYFQYFKLNKIFYGLLIVYGVMIIKPNVWNVDSPYKWPLITLTEKVNQFYKPNDLVITDNWRSAAYLTGWLKGNPEIVVLCGINANQYQFWNKKVKQSLLAHKIQKALYVRYSFYPEVSNCISHFFKKCVKAEDLYSPNKKIFITLFQCNTQAFQKNSIER